MAIDTREHLQAMLGGAYTLESEIGGGGMSRVYVAEETSLRRRVVVKVLPGGRGAGISAERFRREIALAAALQHPHIVPLLSAGEANGVPFYTMPFVDGESLRDRLARDGALPLADAIGTLRELARALAYAHERGVVHRDIKPENVLLSGGVAMVTDFGVAKALRAAAAAGDPLTAAGFALGTPAYMAPEQAAADPDVDHRADLYALGVVAYEMLAGAPPFAGRPLRTLPAAHALETPEDVRRRRVDVPEALADVVMRLLEKRPADRPGSAVDVLRALDPLTTPAVGVPAQSARAPWRVAPLAAAAIGLVVLAALVAVVALLT